MVLNIINFYILEQKFAIIKPVNKNIPFCIFCGNEADSKDHIPSKNLLEKPFPPNLLTIDSCIKCNRSFSLDEEYFLNVLVEISTNPALLIKKEEGGNIFRARERSPKLKERIENSMISQTDGRIYFHPEYDRIQKVVEKNAAGLYFHKYGLRRPLNEFHCTGVYPFSVEELRPPDIFLLAYSERFKPKKWTIIQDNVFSYIVVRDWRRNNGLTMIFHIHDSVWCTISIPYPKQKAAEKRQLNLF